MISPNFPKNCMKLKEFRPWGRTSLAPPLRSATGLHDGARHYFLAQPTFEWLLLSMILVQRYMLVLSDRGL